MDVLTKTKVPGRWAVMGSFMGINLTIQVLWISLSPITGPAALFYGVDEMAVSLFAMVFMVAFIPLSIPVSWAIDRLGFRWPVSFGALLMGACGVIRGLAGNNYAIALAATLGMAIAQPFLLNAWTKVPANWMPQQKRAWAVGLITLASLLGTALGQVLPPVLLEVGLDIPEQQLWFGLVALASALVFVLLARELPFMATEASLAEVPSPVRPGTSIDDSTFQGLRRALSSRNFLMALGISFVGLGLFNGLNTWMEPIIRPRGFNPGDAGNLGALMVLSGLAGAVIMPALSDREGKRGKYIVLGLLGCLPGLAGLTLASDSVLLYLSAAELGFFLVSVMPLTMQYAAEITHPVPEGTSNGLIQLFGQGAVVFVYLMGILRGSDGSFTLSLVMFLILMGLCVLLALRLKEAVLPSLTGIGLAESGAKHEAPVDKERVLETYQTDKSEA